MGEGGFHVEAGGVVVPMMTIVSLVWSIVCGMSLTILRSGASAHAGGSRLGRSGVLRPWWCQSPGGTGCSGTGDLGGGRRSP